MKIRLFFKNKGRNLDISSFQVLYLPSIELKGVCLWTVNFQLDIGQKNLHECVLEYKIYSGIFESTISEH